MTRQLTRQYKFKARYHSEDLLDGKLNLCGLCVVDSYVGITTKNTFITLDGSQEQHEALKDVHGDHIEKMKWGNWE